MIRALSSELDSRSFRRASSLRRLDLGISSVSCFPSGVEFPSVTTSVSQLSRREPNKIRPIPHPVEVFLERGFDLSALGMHSDV